MVRTEIVLPLRDAALVLRVAECIEDLDRSEVRAVKVLRAKVQKQKDRLLRVLFDHGNTVRQRDLSQAEADECSAILAELDAVR